MNRFIYSFLMQLSRFIQGLPLRTALGVGRVLGGIAFFTFVPRTRIAIRNLRDTLGREKGAWWCYRTIFRMYRHFGMNLIDFLRLPLLTHDEFRESDSKRVRVEGLSHLQETLRQGKGALMLSAHFGNWELLSAWMVRQGHPTNIIAKRIRQPVLDDFCRDIRQQVGVHSIHKKNAIREVIERLKKNELVGFVLDQRVNEREGVVVSFFGRPAGTISGLAVLSLRYDLPVLPVFIHREEDLGHRVSVGAPVVLPLSGDRIQDVRNLTQKYSDILEQQVRLYPEQWIWLHKRWSD